MGPLGSRMARVRVVGLRVCLCHFGRHGAWSSFPRSALIHFLGEHVFVLLFLAADRVIDFVCVFGFGRHWVKRGYIPLGANS